MRTYGSSKGFWFQDTAPDDNPATSEGVFVFTSSTPTVAVGDSVQVSGTVTEYYPGGKTTGGQSLTQISKPTVTVVSSGNAVPAPVVITAKTVPAAYTPAGDPAADNSVEGLTLQPKKYALDFYESVEGENVQVKDVRVVGATDAYAELWVTTKPKENATKRGGTLYSSYEDQNSGRLQIQSLIPTATQAFPTANVGDILTGTTAGPLDFNSFGGYTLAARTIGTLKDNGLTAESTRKQKKGELAIATYNVENLAPSDSDAKYARLGTAIVTHLASPDVVALEEIQDNSGATDDGTVDADKTVQKFIDAIVAAAWAPPTTGAPSAPSTTWTAASPAATSARSSSSTRPGSPSPPAPAATPPPPSASRRSTARPRSPPPPAGSRPPTRPGPPAASRWPPSSPSRASRSS